MQALNDRNVIENFSKLDVKSLQQVFNDEVCFLHVPGYANKKLCEKLSQWFLGNTRLEPHPHEIRNKNQIKYVDYGVSRVGVSYHTTYGKNKESCEWQHYYHWALQCIQNLRAACSPQLSPMDQFRLELDEIWPQGANIASFENKKMFAGIGRIMEASLSHLVEQQPHFDAIPEKVVNLIGQFSANIYLQVPDVGGELEVWHVDPIPLDLIEDNNLEKDWRSKLPASRTVKPEVGDLIIFNTRRPHAVRSFKEGKRITIQSFIGLKRDGSLSLWT